MSATPHEYEILIKEHHLDTFGHVNNATYLQLLEEARWDLITKNGYGLDTVQKLKLGPTILEVTLKFKREIGNRRKIRVLTRLERYEGKVGVLLQDIVDDEDRLCCEGRFVFGLFDLTARKLVVPTPEWAAAMGLPPRT